MTDPFLAIVVGIAALTTAAAGGVYLGFSTMVMPALRGADPRDATGTMNRINVFAVRSAFMVVFLGSALASVVAVFAAFPGLPSMEAVLAIVGGVLGVAAFLVTAAVNVPLNNRLAADRDGAGYAAFERRWSRANTARGTLSLLGAVSFIGALVA
ncbi:hypothetical protein ASE16_13880 [Leifsonia sp. Root227]|uniref:DUF1772 domain-containing protein n=1 Tax=Leifsonia sp. Root227 TaxID=1736496 RepID=UPI0006F87E82|nr:DUF1772 domain-containing protein [Leifsonia sp. Root227]KRC49772.1 hypothetical protein ASE16_13880 [Leifsonia sp. Root227]